MRTWRICGGYRPSGNAGRKIREIAFGRKPRKVYRWQKKIDCASVYYRRSDDVLAQKAAKKKIFSRRVMKEAVIYVKGRNINLYGMKSGRTLCCGQNRSYCEQTASWRRNSASVIDVYRPPRGRYEMSKRKNGARRRPINTGVSFINPAREFDYNAGGIIKSKRISAPLSSIAASTFYYDSKQQGEAPRRLQRSMEKSWWRGASLFMSGKASAVCRRKPFYKMRSAAALADMMMLFVGASCMSVSPIVLWREMCRHQRA